MSMIVQANMPLINAQRNYKINTGNRAKSTEKLSSGYRINRSADDAAGLAISEKMRRQIRGLDRGTRNGQDGVSWVQVGDGALGEVQAILHRMKELTVQALNDTNTDADRAALQAEMDSLQSEIDRITDTTQFNTKNIFADHEATYYQYQGNVVWNQSQRHVINQGENDLIIKYVMDENSAAETATITIPAGEYTTQELTDEIEDALIANGYDEKGINVEYTDQGTFNINLEGGQKIEDVGGELAYLLYDTYEGGSVGALIGTTYFPNDYEGLTISSQNNNISFDVEDFNGVTTNVDITLPTGEYTRPELIEILNNKLSGTSVVASAYGSGIKLASDDAIITGFKGNMFKIDGGTNPYTSIFYDNVKYGNITMTAGSFKGGAVIPTLSKDLEHQTFKISSANNQLTFTANDSTTPVTIEIPANADGSAKEYTINEIVSVLNTEFVANGLELNASIYTEGGYKGINILSSVKGSMSKVGLDSASSAYNTLFVNRVYNAYVDDAAYHRETTENKDAIFTGGMKFDGSNPLTITSGVNDVFVLSLDGQEYDITLDAGTYNSASDLRDAIDEKLNGTNASMIYKGVVDVSVVNGAIRLSVASDKQVKNVLAKAKTTTDNAGFDNIFVGKNYSYKYASVSNTGSNTTKPQITLNTPITNPTTITEADKNLTITIDGRTENVELPVGDNVTPDDILDAINNANNLKEYTVTTNNTFSDAEDTGETNDNNFGSTGSNGSEPVTYKNYYEEGKTEKKEGEVGNSVNEPAVVTMDKAIPESMTIDSTNNQFQITINGVTKSLTLDAGTYSRNGLVNQLQSKIDGLFTKYAGGATVSLDSENKLVFTARLNKEGGGSLSGSSSNIGFNTSTSTFISDIYKTYNAGYKTTDRAMLSTISIDANSRVFNFSYSENGTAKIASVLLDEGNYSQSSFVEMLNRKLDENNVNVTASVSGGRLKLTTDTKGAGNSIFMSSATMGNSVEAIFGPMTTKIAARDTAEQNLLDEIVIDGNSNTFNLTVNGQPYSLTLENGTYNPTDFVNMLNRVFDNEGVKLTANLKGKQIEYVTDDVGREASFKVTYESGGSSMLAMYGQNSKTYAGVTASYNSDGKLVLTGTQNGGTISVNSNSGSVVQEPELQTTYVNPTSSAGYFSDETSYVDGVNITEPVTIDQWNNDLSYNYIENGTSTNVSFSLDLKDYTFSDLENALQEKIDNVLGTGKLEVTVGATGVRIETLNVGSKYYLEDSFSGDFYDKVMCSTKERTVTDNPEISNGTAPNDIAYTIGRKDVRNVPVEIKSGVNDTLSLDFKYGNTTTEFVITLDAGTYKGESLKDMVQEKLNAAMEAQGFEPGMIEVGIGGISTGVTGSNDANALNFKLSKSVRLPVEGEYIIDGVSGNAAFSIFYQTDGELVPAYVKGAKDISKGVTIEDGSNVLSFDVDGTNYSITIPEAEYTSEELINKINELLTAASAPVGAEMDDNVLKLSYYKLGEHKINNISGSAKQQLFFNEYGEIGEEEPINIQLSSEVGDYISLGRPLVNTVSLGINSIAITKPKYGDKALDRIDKALEKVSTIRSDFGAKQNRLEHAIASNNNASENTQAAESRLRDLDMAEEMVDQSKHSILMQAGEAIMAQMMNDAEGVLRLLQ